MTEHEAIREALETAAAEIDGLAKYFRERQRQENLIEEGSTSAVIYELQAKTQEQCAQVVRDAKRFYADV